MPPRKSPSVAPNDSVELREEICELRQQVRLLSIVIDELREELGWITRNGIPPHADSLHPRILQRMALNPCAEDWSEQLVIKRAPARQHSPSDATPAVAPTPLAATAVLHTHFEPGDGVELLHDGRESFGEIISVDPADNAAVVLLIPSHEQVTVSLDDLTRVDPNDHEIEPPLGSRNVPPELENEPLVAPRPPPGELFADPGDQPQLF